MKWKSGVYLSFSDDDESNSDDGSKHGASVFYGGVKFCSTSSGGLTKT